MDLDVQADQLAPDGGLVHLGITVLTVPLVCPPKRPVLGISHISARCAQ
jgi:hypothetical protein